MPNAALTRDLISKAEAVVATGMPGLHRVIAFFAIQRIYTLIDLGRTASSLSIAQIAAFLTAIGWGTLILVRIPAARNSKIAIDTFYRLATMSLLTTAFCTLIGVATVVSGLSSLDLRAVIPLLWSWTAYQTGRHYFVAYQRYRLVILFDLVLISASVGALALCRVAGFSASNALSTALGATAVLAVTHIGVPRFRWSWLKPEAEGLHFGLTNLLSGGIPLVFVPAATNMCGPAFAGALSILSSVIAIGLLMPRAISMRKIAELTKRKATGDDLENTLAAMRRIINRCNAFVLVLNFSAVAVAVAYQSHGAEHMTIALAGILLSILCSVGVCGTTSSSVMMVFEQGAASSRINLATTSIFAVACVGCCGIGGKFGFLMILVCAIAVAGLRNLLVGRNARRARAEYVLHGSKGFV